MPNMLLPAFSDVRIFCFSVLRQCKFDIRVVKAIKEFEDVTVTDDDLNNNLLQL